MPWCYFSPWQVLLIHSRELLGKFSAFSRCHWFPLDLKLTLWLTVIPQFQSKILSVLIAKKEHGTVRVRIFAPPVENVYEYSKSSNKQDLLHFLFDRGVVQERLRYQLPCRVHVRYWWSRTSSIVTGFHLTEQPGGFAKTRYLHCNAIMKKPTRRWFCMPLCMLAMLNTPVPSSLQTPTQQSWQSPTPGNLTALCSSLLEQDSHARSQPVHQYVTEIGRKLGAPVCRALPVCMRWQCATPQVHSREREIAMHFNFWWKPACTTMLSAAWPRLETHKQDITNARYYKYLCMWGGWFYTCRY